MSKKCNRCKETFEAELFPVRVKRGKKTLGPYCKICEREYQNEHYHKHKERNRELRRKSVKAIRIRNKQYLWGAKEAQGCIDCGESEPIILEGHHTGDGKINHLSDMANDCVSIETLQAEIDKCVMLCANCHRKRTAKEKNWHKDIKKNE